MKIYTKNGDQGLSSLISQKFISKDDDRFEAMGSIDELSAHLGLLKVLSLPQVQNEISQIQRDLMGIMSKVADPFNREYNMDPQKVQWLEQLIDDLEANTHRPKDFVLYGGCEASARADVARAVCRRAERRFITCGKRFGKDKNAQSYLNRLSDYLYVYGRSLDGEQPPATDGKQALEKIIREKVEQALLNSI